MCSSTRFSLAIPLKNIKANTIIKVQESLEFNPFKLVFGHSVGGPFWKKNVFVKILLLEQKSRLDTDED